MIILLFVFLTFENILYSAVYQGKNQQDKKQIHEKASPKKSKEKEIEIS